MSSIPNAAPISKRSSASKRTFRSTASYGKREEFVAITELLKLNYDVYQTLVDDQGIDCVVRFDSPNGAPYYLDVQIKARSGNAKQPRRFEMKLSRAQDRGSYFFILYCEKDNVHWIIPASDLKNGVATKSRRKWIVNVPPVDAQSKRRKLFEKYRNRFDLLGRYDPDSDFDSGDETREILADKELSRRLRGSSKSARLDKTVALEAVKKRALS